MDKTQIENALIELQKSKVQLTEILRGYDELRAKLIPPELQQELADLEAERTNATASLVSRIGLLEESIKVDTLKLGETVKVTGIGSAVFNKGRVSWETKGLEGLMVAVPQLAQFRKIGDPYITLKGA